MSKFGGSKKLGNSIPKSVKVIDVNEDLEDPFYSTIHNNIKTPGGRI
jgi:hypothetical protein